MYTNELIAKIRSNHTGLLGKTALIEGRESLTFGELWDLKDQCSEKLLSRGVCKGDVVAIRSANSIRLGIFFLALVDIGAVPFVVNYKLDVLKIDTLNISFFLVNNKLMSGGTSQELAEEDFRKEDWDDYFTLFRNKKQFKPITDGAFLVTSSGSKGSPKIVKLTVQGTIRNIQSNTEALSIRDTDITVVALPMGYSYGLVGQFLSHLYVGATIILTDGKFFLAEIGSLLNKYRVTTLFMVPPMIRQINYLQSKGFYKMNTSSLRFVTIGGNRMEQSSILKAMGFFGCPIVKTYGLAEAGPRVCTNVIPSQEYREINSVGKANNGIKVSIIDKSGNSLAVNQLGTIHINSPSVTSGYLNARLTRLIKPFNAITTKDIGYISETGNLYIMGRKKESFYIGKRQLWFQEIENILYSHFNLLKLSLEKENRKIKIKTVSMYDYAVNPDAIIEKLSDTLNTDAGKMFRIEMIKTNEFLSEK
ncbi:Acyl-CoA synthetase (AMP-forming)/AMP-acid ligase II [Pseudarcicella hirudinis]|uniref:Acyl-CoA synthetase (AMP-forming)/AMP-acid ligase II n=1 Tax=Pseudarcicella hirudinis TaxID=1079859 RepID=A0A1I5TGD4_9BACT|nr:class I adenylate-forming enzyme family protein [Pseudarcicella hirudinis]SFP82093.1 Acyl-CoA synthetase (AMP-forming)/AMP-acid ligase II [Pseudarcicella hirudinis]